MEDVQSYSGDYRHDNSILKNAQFAVHQEVTVRKSQIKLQIFSGEFSKKVFLENETDSYYPISHEGKIHLIGKKCSCCGLSSSA